jgi:hypothetical protein
LCRMQDNPVSIHRKVHGQNIREIVVRHRHETGFALFQDGINFASVMNKVCSHNFSFLLQSNAKTVQPSFRLNIFLNFEPET